MTLEERIRENFTRALKARDERTVSALRLLLTSLKNQAIAKRGALEESDVLEVLQREAKHRREAMELYRQGDRGERAQQEEQELTIIQEYLPEQLSEEKLHSIVQEVIGQTQPAGPSDFGRVMGLAMKQLKGKVEGQRVQAAVKEALARLTQR